MEPQTGCRECDDPIVQIERISEADMLIFEADTLTEEMERLATTGASCNAVLKIQAEIAAVELAVDKVKDWLLTVERVFEAPWARERMAVARRVFKQRLVGAGALCTYYDSWADVCINQLAHPPQYCRKSWLRSQAGRNYLKSMDNETRLSYRRHMQKIAALGIRNVSEERTSTNLILLCNRVPEDLIPPGLGVDMYESERICTILYNRWPIS